jgi:hypothetical protein
MEMAATTQTPRAATKIRTKRALSSCSSMARRCTRRPTLALSGGRRASRGGHRKQAKRACGRPLERGVGHSDDDTTGCAGFRKARH